ARATTAPSLRRSSPTAVRTPWISPRGCSTFRPATLAALFTRCRGSRTPPRCACSRSPPRTSRSKASSPTWWPEHDRPRHRYLRHPYPEGTALMNSVIITLTRRGLLGKRRALLLMLLPALLLGIAALVG